MGRKVKMPDLDYKTSRECDPPRMVFVDGIRKDISGESMDHVLERIRAEDIEEIRYISCWDRDVPIQHRNSIWIRIIDTGLPPSAFEKKDGK
jgi:hypothetical protein